MKSTKDNRPAVKFSDIVKELHSYANSEQAIDDFASELLKIANLPEEFDLSQHYFEDNEARKYFRKKTNLKNIILSGINKRTTNFNSLRKDFVESYQDYFEKYITTGNPFVNTLRMLLDFNLYYDIKKKKFFIYEGRLDYSIGSFGFQSKKDFSGTYVARIDTIFPVSFSGKTQNSNLLFVRSLSGLDDLPSSITCESDLLLLKYISGVIDIKEFCTEFLKDINLYVENTVDTYLDLSKENCKNYILSNYPASIFTEDEIIKYIDNQLFDSETYNYISGLFENREDNEYFCSFLEKYLNPSVIDGAKILSLIASEPHFEFEKLPGLKSKDKKELILKLMKKSSGKVPVVLLDYFDKDDLYQLFKNTIIYQLNKMINSKKITNKNFNYFFIGRRVVSFDGNIPNIVLNREQVVELKREIIPLLEQVQDKLFLKTEANGIYPVEGSKSTEENFFKLLYSYQYKTTLYYKLCHLLDWYPEKFRILSELGGTNNDCFGKLCYLNQLKKKYGLDVKYTFFIHEDSLIKSDKDLFDIIGGDFDDVQVLFEGNSSKTDLKDIDLKKSYGKMEEIASISLSY